MSIEIYTGEELSSLDCYCKVPDDGLSAVSLLDEMGRTELKPENITCVISNVVRSLNSIITMNLQYNSPLRLALTDVFYRVRHELLFKGVMSYLGLNQIETDVPFSMYNIPSNRTPDYIGRHDDSLVIIEVTATSTFEKGAQQKGLESAGFESKYKKEIDMLTLRGEVVKYIPIIFEMSSIESMEFEIGLSEAASIIVNQRTNKSLIPLIVKELKIITVNIKDYLTAPSSIIFSNPLIIKQDHPTIKFLYEYDEGDECSKKYDSYEEHRISSKIYMKIMNSWPSLYHKIRRLDDTKKYKLIVDVINNKVYFEVFKNSISKQEWEDIYDKDLKRNVFEHTLIKLGNEYKECNDSETGFTYLLKKKQGVSNGKNVFNLMATYSEVGHSPTEYTGFEQLNMEKYDILSENYKNVNLKPNYFVQNYEENIFKFIKKLDDFCTSNDKSEYSYHEEMNSEKSFLGECKIKEYDIDSIVSGMKSAYSENNKFDENLPLKKQKMKNPFILPMPYITQSNYTGYKFKNLKFLSILEGKIKFTDPFTALIIQKCMEPNYKFGEEQNQPSDFLTKLMNERSQLSRESTLLYKNMVKTFNNSAKDKRTQKEKTVSSFVNSFKVDSLPDDFPHKHDFLRNKKSISTLSKKIEDQFKAEKIKRNINMIRFKTKRVKKTKDKPHVSDTYLTSLFRHEMEHFKDRTKQSTIEGVGLTDSVELDYKRSKKIINSVVDLMPTFCGNNPDSIIDLSTYEDCRLLKDCKDYSISSYKNLIQQVRDSFIGHASALVSRMAHSLLFYSQLPFSSDYIRVDNLGYKDVLMFVKGGKKIFKTKSSKLFRMVYPINSSMVSLYKSEKIGKSSSEVIYIEERPYLLTPWSLMHESILNDALSFYSRISSFIILNSDPALDYSKQHKVTAVNVLLAFHNRRQTETLLANLRYILLSTIGEYSAFTGVLKEFVGFNYDIFQSYIRGSIVCNYGKYFKEINSISKLRDEAKGRKTNKVVNDSDFSATNIFTETKMKSVDELALMIYSTFLMTKAPYQRSVERADNLKGILDIHCSFKTAVGVNNTPKEQLEKISVDLLEPSINYVNELFANDYKIDPYFITQVGIFADSYFNSRDLKEKIFITWNRILNENWDSMATSTGLRGKFDDTQNFWGKKGYFVVYNEIQKNTEYMSRVEVLLNDLEVDDDFKKRELRKLNLTFLDKIREPAKILIFHAVDKTQWRGGREIYVMDLDTKGEQQPIEKFMGELCKMVDNELISIPSDKRAQTIHHAIFEKDLPLKETLTYYMTLDCSKWAPKSMFVKFSLMIIPMTCIPHSFKMHFLNYLEKLYYKRIYFNNSEVEVLLNNPKFKVLIGENLIKDDNLNGYYMLMPYSWVMGIFNYTSSFLHAMNQKYMSYLINQTSIENFGMETTLVMFAHSDDSGGRISSTQDFLIQRGLIIYEIGLKACNHLLSKKKCTVSLVYFEILSIIYLFKKLLALLPKFLGGIRFLPTDKGMAQDMLQSYSKSIEVMVSGGDFTIAYLVMKIHSYLTWRFYMNTPPSKIDYERPVQYLGIPDAHPMIVLLSGSDSDIIRLIDTKGDDYICKLMALVKNSLTTYDDEGPIRSLKFQIQIRNAVKGFEVNIEKYRHLLNNWTVKNANMRNTPFSYLNFLSKLNDPGFIGSLLNESPIRRVSRSYFLRSGQSVITSYGPQTLKWTHEVLTSYQSYICGDSAITSLVGATNQDLGNDNNSILADIETKAEQCRININMFKISVQNIMKIYKYFNQITLEGKNFLNTNRTLKPTHIEIIKTSKPFSVDFSPSNLVSYCKNPEFRWAIPDIGNILTAESELEKLLTVHKISIEDIDEGTMMKLLNQFTGRSVKDIYLYSHVPTEIRTMRTYSSLLSFLSVNSVKGKEISGLVLKLSSDLTDPGYLPLQIDENIYIANTLIVTVLVMSKILGWDFISKLKIKGPNVLNITASNMSDFLQKLKVELNENYYLTYILPLINYIEEKLDWPNRQPTGRIFKGGSYYTFTKSQKIKSGWYGKGEITIVIGNDIFKFELLNNNITSCYTNVLGKLDKITFDYVTDTLTSNDIFISAKVMRDPTKINTEVAFGFDASGDLKIAYKRELRVGVECHYISSLSGDLAHLDRFYVEHREDNSFILNLRSAEGVSGSIKLRTMKILKGELLNTVRMFFDKEDFRIKLDESGIEDFDDFLLTEILTEFGGENYIDFQTLVDNFQSSETYKIMKWMQDTDKIPYEELDFGNLPGSSGGLLKGFIDYGEENKTYIIKSPGKVSRALMNIRSEYPENFTAILNEKMMECYKDIYNSEERQEIRLAYQKMVTAKDQESVRAVLVELMCYWGYSSLVNTVQLFSNLQVEANYKIFKITGFTLKDQAIYSELFEKSLTILNDAISSFSHIIRNINTKFQRFLYGKKSFDDIIVNNVKTIVNSLYGFRLTLVNAELAEIRFLNLLDALLDMPEFTELLTEKYSDLYPMSMLPIDQENKYNFIVSYNTLKTIWMKTNSKSYSLNYMRMVERGSGDFVQPYILQKRFTNLLTPADTYYHGIFNREYKSKITTAVKGYRIRNQDFDIYNKIANFSDQEVPLLKELGLYTKLNDEVFEHENWEEIIAEFGMGDIDIDTIIEYWEEIDNRFKESSEEVINGKVQIEVNWVSFFCKEGTPFPKMKVRQIGDCVVILTTSYQEVLLNFPNTYCRLVTIKTGSYSSDFLAYCILPPTLNENFVNALLGKNTPPALSTALTDLNYNKLRTPDGIQNSYELGVNFDELLKTFENEGNMSWGDVPVDNETLQTDYRLAKITEIKNNMKEIVDEAKETNPALCDVYDRLMLKYTNQLNKEFTLSNELLIESMITEMDLNELNSAVKGEITESLSKEQLVSIYTSPTVFGMTSTGGVKKTVNFKNKHVKAELESLNQDLADKIASGTLTISPQYRKNMVSNLKLWSAYIEKTNHKQEQKKFLWNLIKSVCVDSVKIDSIEDDYLWRDLIEKTSNYIAEDKSEVKLKTKRFEMTLKQGSRMKYRHKGN